MTKLIIGAMLLLAAAAMAQSPQPAPSRQSATADMEPGVNTSAPSATPQPPDSQRSGAVSVAKPSRNPAAAGAAAKPATPPAGVAANKPADATRKGNAKDRLDLESSQITGNRELPKVLYIVPWRSAELGDLVGRPVNSLLDEVLEPVDRDVFRRQNRYFEALQPNEATPAKQPEK
jgi:hypothetical protein